MRTREEIEESIIKVYREKYETGDSRNQGLIIELLLDIRDLLSPSNEEKKL